MDTRTFVLRLTMGTAVLLIIVFLLKQDIEAKLVALFVPLIALVITGEKQEAPHEE